MIVERSILSKTYNGLDLDKITNVLRVDDYSSMELKEIFEDSISIVEDYLQKPVAYTLIEYVFSNGYNQCMGFYHVIVDEGNFSSISGITYKDVNNNIVIVDPSEYTIKRDSNQFVIMFNNAINVKELKITFYAGYPDDTINKSIRRGIYIVLNDLYDAERSSYSVGSSKKSDVLNRLLDPHKKIFFHNYNSYYNNIF
jgi:hypothetical protein